MEPPTSEALDGVVSAAVTTAKSVFEQFYGKVAEVLTRASNSLEGQIPKYAPYVIEAYDADKIRENLITDKDWGHIAKDWVTLSKVRAMAETLGSSHPEVRM